MGELMVAFLFWHAVSTSCTHASVGRAACKSFRHHADVEASCVLSDDTRLGRESSLYPEAYVRIPLGEPFGLRIAVTARTPEGALPQVMTVAMNGDVLTSASLTTSFKEIRFVTPKKRLVAAHVERIQLP